MANSGCSGARSLRDNTTARLLSGKEQDIKECTYTLIDADQRGTLSVLDWLPRTELKTEFAKPIRFNSERSAKIGISMSARYIVSATADTRYSPAQKRVRIDS
jgi:hypothetical protein